MKNKHFRIYVVDHGFIVTVDCTLEGAAGAIGTSRQEDARCYAFSTAREMADWLAVACGNGGEP